VGSRINAHLEHLFLAFENKCVKLNTDRPIQKQLSCCSFSLVFGNIKFMRVFAGVLASNDSGVVHHAHMLHSHAEVYSLCV